MASLGTYEVVHALKQGGMGEVLLARRRGPGGVERLVAIKTIRAELSGATAVRAMFLDEAGILSRLTHPAIATVHDFGEDGQTLFLVMEYVAGIPFRDLMARRPPPVIAARAISEACRGVHAAHQLRDHAGNLLGVVHRDISPENLMLGFDGHVKVIDFGIALVKGRQTPVTELGMIKGKPPYMSPEQVKNEAIDRQSDVFSLSVVLHELLTGQPLFDGESIYAVARAVEHAEIAPPSRLAGSLPAGLDAAVMHGLERDRTRRTPTAAALAEELEAVVMAAGGETLEAWSERELAAASRAHREWLATVLAGGAAKIGRPTGAITAVPEALARTPVAPPPGPPAPAPPPAIEPPAGDELAPRRSRRAAVVAALVVALLLAAVATVVVVATRHGAAGGRDAGSPAADAPVVTPAVIDAAQVVAVDAAPVVTAPPDAGVVTRDARPGHAGRDAAPTPRADARPAAADAAPAAATGVAYLTCTADPFATVRFDTRDLGSTPFWRKEVPAGRHRVVFTSADRGRIVLDRTLDLAPGQTVELSP